jgi:ornithine carbamoyltransferase
VHASRLFGNAFAIACPEEFGPDQALLSDIRAAGSKVTLDEDPVEAVKDADLVITDTWVSMGDTDVSDRRKHLKPYRVDTTLLGQADKDALFMHCLPAHRGDEVTDEVIDGPQSVVFDEAENRLHAQKAILCWCFGIDTV